MDLIRIVSSWSPYHGAVYAVTGIHQPHRGSTAEITHKIRFTFQEYFRRMSEEPSRWSQPFAAFLGAYSAQMGFGLPSIGGKDSMSGTFNDIDVPPTLVSFAVDIAKQQDIITPELKKAGNKLMMITIDKDAYDLPDYAASYEAVWIAAYSMIQDGKTGIRYMHWIVKRSRQQQSARWHSVISWA